MKIYKHWYKKFVQDYALQKAKTPQSINFIDFDQDSLKKIFACLNVSTLLPNSLVHQLLYLSLTFASIFLVYQLSIPRTYSVVLSLSISFLTFYDIYKFRKQRKKLNSLQCIDHVWFLKYAQGHYDKLELQKISQGLGFLYLLSFVNTEVNTPIRICIWKYQSTPKFWAYCSQLCSIGQKDS